HGAILNGLDVSPWQILEHLRIEKWDILECLRNVRQDSPIMPRGYRPTESGPDDEKTWHKSVLRMKRNLNDMANVVNDPTIDFFAKVPHGNGKTVLHEVLLMASDSSYYVAQLMLVRRLLGRQ